MNSFLRILFALIYPQRCAYCGKIIPYDRLMCEECEASLPRICGEVCVKCGREKKMCSCKNAERYFKRIAAPFYYTGEVRKGIHAFKFRKWRSNSEAFGREMSETVSKIYGGIHFDFITEVPLTEKSRRERSYNQCELLAKQISRNLGIEHKKKLLVKLYETKKQHLTKPLFRKGNLCGVFDVTDPSAVEGKVVLLCDDISTTGETFNECAKMLWLNGAKEVYCIALALTPKSEK